MEKKFQKGTTTVGIVCKDGIVLAADKRSSAGYTVASKKMDKISPVSDYLAITMAGLVSDAQLITKLVKAQLTLNKLRTRREPSVKEAANLIASILYQNIRKFSMVPGIVAFILGGKDNEGFKLYELGVDGSITPSDDFRSEGSGSSLAYGVLETLYTKDITVKDGVKLALKAINAAVQRDLATGDGIDVVTITDQGVKKVLTKELIIKIE